jgi:signal transduction histidine kinase
VRDLLLIVGLALASSGAVALIGALVLRVMPGRSVLIHVTTLLVVTVASVLAGVIAVAQAIFISAHDLQVLLVVLTAANLASLVVVLAVGRRLGQASMWAAEAQARERQLERRREIVAWVSHDLRTHLAGLRAMTEALEDRVVTAPEAVADYHHRMRVDVDRLSALVDDLFELARIDAGAPRLTMHAVSLGDVVSDAVAMATPMAQAKGVRLVSSPGTYGVVAASEPELGRVFVNLLVNAIRHTPADGVVTVDGGADDSSGWVRVTDSCGGIPEPDLDRVFDVAFRAEAARGRAHDDEVTRSGRGGLGLAIVRGLIAEHNGSVAVANVDGGCRFTVRLPTVN